MWAWNWGWDHPLSLVSACSSMFYKEPFYFLFGVTMDFLFVLRWSTRAWIAVTGAVWGGSLLRAACGWDVFLQERVARLLLLSKNFVDTTTGGSRPHGRAPKLWTPPGTGLCLNEDVLIPKPLDSILQMVLFLPFPETWAPWMLPVSLC